MADMVQRREDMSPNGRLGLFREDDGDILVFVIDDEGVMATVQFCTSGTRSHHTLMALVALFEAMMKDHQERPHD